jgi:hypothetical protein
VLACCALAPGVTGCGDDAPRAEQTATREQSPPTSDREPREPAEPVLNRRDAPPAGVLRQVSHYGIGDQLCIPDGSPKASLSILPFYSRQSEPAYEPDIGEVLVLCATDFRPELAIEQTLALPDGRVLRRTDPAGATALSRSWNHFLDETWPVGRHVFAVRQGEVVRRVAFRVLLPQHRGVRSAQGAVHPGDVLHLVIVGQRPRALVRIDVYASRPDGPSRYATTLTARTDARGIGTLDLVPSPRDVGQYLLRPRTATEDDGQDAMASVSVVEPPPPPPAAPDTGGRPPTIFQASQQPPRGMPPTLEFLAVADTAPDCSTGDAGPHIAWSRDQSRAWYESATDQAPEIGDRLTLCADGFPSGAPLRLAIEGPDGARRVVRMPRPSGTDPTRSIYTQTFLPGARLGAYRVVVTGGAARAESGYWLSEPSAPGYRLLTDDGKVSLLAVGLPPRQAVSLHVYRGPRPQATSAFGNAEYAGAVPARAGTDGTVRVELALDPDDPPGCYPTRLAYGVRVVPPAAEGTRVCLPLDPRAGS